MGQSQSSSSCLSCRYGGGDEGIVVGGAPQDSGGPSDFQGPDVVASEARCRSKAGGLEIGGGGGGGSRSGGGNGGADASSRSLTARTPTAPPLQARLVPSAPGAGGAAAAAAEREDEENGSGGEKGRRKSSKRLVPRFLKKRSKAQGRRGRRGEEASSSHSSAGSSSSPEADRILQGRGGGSSSLSAGGVVPGVPGVRRGTNAATATSTSTSSIHAHHRHHHRHHRHGASSSSSSLSGRYNSSGGMAGGVTRGTAAGLYYGVGGGSMGGAGGGVGHSSLVHPRGGRHPSSSSVPMPLPGGAGSPYRHRRGVRAFLLGPEEEPPSKRKSEGKGKGKGPGAGREEGSDENDSGDDGYDFGSDARKKRDCEDEEDGGSAINVGRGARVDDVECARPRRRAQGRGRGKGRKSRGAGTSSVTGSTGSSEEEESYGTDDEEDEEEEIIERTELVARTLDETAAEGVDVSDPSAVAGTQIYSVRVRSKRRRRRKKAPPSQREPIDAEIDPDEEKEQVQEASSPPERRREDDNGGGGGSDVTSHSGQKSMRRMHPPAVWKKNGASASSTPATGASATSTNAPPRKAFTVLPSHRVLRMTPARRRTLREQQDPRQVTRGCAVRMFTPEAVRRACGYTVSGHNQGQGPGQVHGGGQATTIEPAADLLCVDQTHRIFVCDIGLSDAQCDDIVRSAEICSRGQYAAYTYAKQTLGCREHDELAAACVGPVLTACETVRRHLMRLDDDDDDGGEEEEQEDEEGGGEDNTSAERRGAVIGKDGCQSGSDKGLSSAAPASHPKARKAAGFGNSGNAAEDATGGDDGYDEDEEPSNNNGASVTPPTDESSPSEERSRRPASRPPPPPLVLDDREPHMVKYDVTRAERQKLDTHTDKSEWTFLVSLSEGCGMDYEGGGTYFECLDATVHLQRGHALLFPGRLRHRGQKITRGLRFLLVGFLVDKKENGGGEGDGGGGGGGTGSNGGGGGGGGGNASVVPAKDRVSAVGPVRGGCGPGAQQRTAASSSRTGRQSQIMTSAGAKQRGAREVQQLVRM